MGSFRREHGTILRGTSTPAATETANRSNGWRHMPPRGGHVSTADRFRDGVQGSRISFPLLPGTGTQVVQLPVSTIFKTSSWYVLYGHQVHILRSICQGARFHVRGMQYVLLLVIQHRTAYAPGIQYLLLRVIQHRTLYVPGFRIYYQVLRFWHRYTITADESRVWASDARRSSSPSTEHSSTCGLVQLAQSCSA